MWRYVEWHINIRERDYEVIRRDDGQVVQVAVCANNDEAWCAYKVDRAQVLADPAAREVRSLEYRPAG